ncbi:MAG: segregation/condensation protein A [Gemmiger sp.]|nr:segregation/condensation protein A [Gemmiger sp.]
MDTLTFKIEDFEGPLDLLLYLVGKNKMNLYDINIMALIDQYTAVIATLQGDKLEVASEFIDMAARLVQMKSALLLPRSPEAERMKAELTGRLIEYSTCKAVAAQLGSRARDLYTAVRTPEPLVGAAAYSRRHDPNLLSHAWYNLMGRSLRKKRPQQNRFEPLVTAPFVSVASRVVHLLRGMVRGTMRRMSQLFSQEESRSTNVATFLALLELIRAGRVKIDDVGALTVERHHRRIGEPRGQAPTDNEEVTADE